MEEIANRGIRISSNQVSAPPPPAPADSHSTGGFYRGCCALQVQYSVIDQRPAAKMEQFCLANDIKLLTYGTLGKIIITSSRFGLLSWMRTKKVHLSFRIIDVIKTFF